MSKPRIDSNNRAARELGERLRRLRESRGMSLRALAKLAGITAGTLVKIENRQTSPSVSTLKSVLDALGSTLGEFFASSANTSGDDGPGIAFRPGDLANLSSAAGIAIMSPPRTHDDQSLQVLHETYDPGADTGDQPLRHQGEDAGFCLSGTLELTVDGRRYVLGPGDAFHYRSDLPHRWRNIGKSRAVVVAACTPPTF